jgi:hypothetical protein
MGAAPAVTGPGVARYACTVCVRSHGLKPPPVPPAPEPVALRDRAPRECGWCGRTTTTYIAHPLMASRSAADEVVWCDDWRDCHAARPRLRASL